MYENDCVISVNKVLIYLYFQEIENSTEHSRMISLAEFGLLERRCAMVESVERDADVY
jgi:hypothetical protein